jgi:hypothetical protein
VRTEDGKCCMDIGATESGDLWATERRKQLATIAGTDPGIPYHSLLAELGKTIVRLRKIIVSNGARVYPEYLVAYRRHSS